MDKLGDKEVLEYFEKLSSEITGKFEKIRLATSHAGGKGSEGEEEVAKLINTFMGNLYRSYTRRQVIDSQNNRTHQCDVLVAHRNIPMQGLMDTDTGYIFAEAVACILEVKFRLDSATLRDAVKKLRELSHLELTASSGHMADFHGRTDPKIFTGFFAYSTSLSIVDIARALKRINKDEEITEKERIDWIFVHNTGLIVNLQGGVKIKDLEGKFASPSEDYVAVEAKEHTLLKMLVQLQEIDITVLRRFDPNAYFHGRSSYTIYY